MHAYAHIHTEREIFKNVIIVLLCKLTKKEWPVFLSCKCGGLDAMTITMVYNKNKILSDSCTGQFYLLCLLHHVLLFAR